MIAIVVPFFLFLSKIACQNPHEWSLNERFQVVFEIDYFNFTWQSDEQYQTAVQSGTYNASEIYAYGIKVRHGEVYLTLPRFFKGAPVSFASFPLNSSRHNPLLRPFPNWEAHNISSVGCSGLVNVLSLEIDSQNIMWLVDGNRCHSPTDCPSKLILINLSSGEVLQTYEFSDSLSPIHGGWLNEIVVDERDGGFAYIAEGSETDPGIIVYSRQENRAWKLRARSMFAETNAGGFRVHGVPVDAIFDVYGLALSPNSKQHERKIYYSAFTGYTLYSLSTNILRNESIILSGGNWRKLVKTVGRKASSGNGMIIDNIGTLFYSLVPLDSIGRWNIYQNPFDLYARIMYTNHSTIDSPDMLDIDENGNIYTVSTGQEYRFTSTPNANRPPTRILSRHIKHNSYIYS